MSEPGNGKVDFQQAHSFDLVIRWVPEVGQIQVSWPELDDVAKLGMLEMAKQVLAEHRSQSVAVKAAQSGLVIPSVKQ